MTRAKANSLRLEFDNNVMVALLSGEHNQHLAHIEKSLDVTVDSFGNCLTVSGSATATRSARQVIESLYKCLADGTHVMVDKALVDDSLRWVTNGSVPDGPHAGTAFDTWKKKIVAKTRGQADYMLSLIHI